MDQQHLFLDAIALAALGIACLVDAALQEKLAMSMATSPNTKLYVIPAGKDGLPVPLTAPLTMPIHD